MALAMAGVQAWSEFPFQRRNLICLGIAGGAAALLLVWWLFGSRARWAVRLVGLAGVAMLAGMARWTLRIRGVTGDLIPIVETRWARPAPSAASAPAAPAAPPTPGIASQASPQVSQRRIPGDYPQFLGENRSGIVSGISIQPHWNQNPPQLLWKQPVGGAWSGFSVVGDRAVTQEQGGEEEWVVCRDVVTGHVLWKTANPGRYFTPIAGEGPRSSPTLTQNRVITLGARGWLQVLELSTGKRLWGTNILEFSKAGMPEWGLSGSPLVVSNKVIVSRTFATGHRFSAISPLRPSVFLGKPML
jgi:outer membrane protein assembly factor BamB